MKIMGLDIGGANTDCAIVNLNENNIMTFIKKNKVYLPMWKDNDKLPECLLKLTENDKDIDVICVTMTAELADSYTTKKEGVLDISNKVVTTFPDKDIFFVTLEGLKTYEEILENPLIVAAANWVGTAHIIGYIKKDCIFIDMGSTTTDIIPIKDGKEVASGHTDLERLGTGELVYTGMLRTNLATIVNQVPVNNVKTGVSSELFSITADIHRILGHISEKEYTCDTPDGKGKDIVSCKRRLSRLVCADLDSLSDANINNITHYIHEKQIHQLTKGLLKVVENNGMDTVIITDLGHGNVCELAAKRLGLNIINIADYFSKEAMSILTAIGAIQMYLEEYIAKELPLGYYV